MRSDIQVLSKWSCIPNYTSYTSLIFLTPEAGFKALPPPPEFSVCIVFWGIKVLTCDLICEVNWEICLLNINEFLK